MNTFINVSAIGAFGRIAFVAAALAVLIGLASFAPRPVLAIANSIRGLLAVIASISAWLLVVLMCVTLVDVTARMFSKALVDRGFNFPYTKLQELEWHIHAAIFSLWMGYGYVINAHPRVDSYFGGAPQRQRAWVEFIGCLIFAIPYTLVVVYYGWDWIGIAFTSGEASDSANGLTHLWIIKGIYYLGLWLLLFGALSVMLRLATHLFGGKSAEEAELNLGVTQLEV